MWPNSVWFCSETVQFFNTGRWLLGRHTRRRLGSLLAPSIYSVHSARRAHQQNEGRLVARTYTTGGKTNSAAHHHPNAPLLVLDHAPPLLPRGTSKPGTTTISSDDKSHQDGLQVVDVEIDVVVVKIPFTNATTTTATTTTVLLPGTS